ncbi:DUF983 domain-containing protein [Maribacter litoralis]|uniref:DUF983 domain-containing protein n=1 Tax=Maribacter litoralis TaxID=2059726 RepID=UPI000E30F522|nr:DUF983 domain-containing protein [Maribacter litoralis]
MSIRDNKLIKILAYKCPRCGLESAFEKQTGISIFAIPRMKKQCSNCQFRFIKEPGFYYGAMYVSYALTISEAIITFLIAQQFYETTFDPRIIGVISIVIVILMWYNYKLSRMVWLNLFKNHQF